MFGLADFWTYIFTDEFAAYGFFVYWIVFPLFFYILICVCEFLVDYSSFKSYKKAEKEKKTKEQIQFEIKELKDKLKKMDG